MSKVIYVFDNFTGDIPVLLGQLYIDSIKGKEAYSFEYDRDWLGCGTNTSLDPGLLPFEGRQYLDDSSMFGLFKDASPDRWGKVLMKKRERIAADLEGRKPRKLLDSDFLLGVYDESRMGGIRLKIEQDGEFMSDDKETAAPPWATLRSLEEASRQFEDDNNIKKEKWIDQLIRPGSSLGGARPKATVADIDGSLWIAKFPSKHDENNTGAWEKVASDLAQMCGLNVPESRIETFSQYGSTFLIKRFDRNGKRRVHFASAMTLLGKNDGASSADGSSYLELVDFIRTNAINPKLDLVELWKRIVFTMAVSNTDDHMRNHAFIYSRKGWMLSPLFDVNPVPFGDELSLNVSEEDNRISFGLAVDTASFYGLSRQEAEGIVAEISGIVRNNWERLALKYGIGRAGIEDMRPAFSECYG